MKNKVNCSNCKHKDIYGIGNCNLSIYENKKYIGSALVIGYGLCERRNRDGECPYYEEKLRLRLRNKIKKILRIDRG